MQSWGNLRLWVRECIIVIQWKKVQTLVLGTFKNPSGGRKGEDTLYPMLVLKCISLLWNKET